LDDIVIATPTFEETHGLAKENRRKDFYRLIVNLNKFAGLANFAGYKYAI